MKLDREGRSAAHPEPVTSGGAAPGSLADQAGKAYIKASRQQSRDQDPEGGRSPPATAEEATMKWTKPEVEVIELGMEIGAYAGSA